MIWPTVALGEIFDIARGGSPRPIDEYITDAPDGVNWISIKDASNSSKYIERTAKKILVSGVSRSREVKPGDFLLTNSMSFGRPYILRTSGCIHDGWLVLRGDDKVVDQDYFYHLLGSDFVYRKFAALAAGAVVKNLNIDLVKTVSVSLPPLPEQRRIAAILDKADALRAKRREAIAKLDQMLQSVFLDMFGDPVTNPKGLAFKRLGDLCTSKSAYGSSSPSIPHDGVAPRYVRITDIQDDGTLGVDVRAADMRDVDVDGYRLVDGDLLFARSGATVGKAFLYSPQYGDCVYAGYLIRFQPDVRVVLPEYLFGFTRTTAYRAWVSAQAKAVAQPNINAKQYSELQVPVPRLGLQSEFLERVEQIKKITGRHLQSEREIGCLAASLQQMAFSGRL